MEILLLIAYTISIIVMLVSFITDKTDWLIYYGFMAVIFLILALYVRGG